jgi:hypothetical protein
MSSGEAAGGAGDGTSRTVGSLPFDVSKANQARIYDYVLGGKDNFAADREAAEAFRKITPELVFSMQANRAFLGRAIRYLAGEAGIRQFLDIGTGIPTGGNTHEVAQAIAPESRVVYVDYDPVVLAHARALLSSSDAGATKYVQADLRETDSILAQAAELLDFTKPVAVTMLAILHVIPDADDPYAIVATVMDAMPSGSYLAISHGGLDFYDQAQRQRAEEVARQTKRQQEFIFRTREQVKRFFDGVDLVEPGVVPVHEWRVEPGARDTRNSVLWCAVGRKP